MYSVVTTSSSTCALPSAVSVPQRRRAACAVSTSQQPHRVSTSHQPHRAYLGRTGGSTDARYLGREGFLRGTFHLRSARGAGGSSSRKLPNERKRLRGASVKTYAKSSGDKDQSANQAPLKPDSPAGQFLNYILESEPQLFTSAMDKQLDMMLEEAEKDEAAAAGSTQMVLSQRINEVKVAQRRRALEDLMYANILHKFGIIGVDLIPSLDGISHIVNANYKALTEGVHSEDALQLVKQHLSTMLGDAPAAYSNVMIKISKLQAAQVYAASVMFGYFLRRADKRFQLEQTLGTLPKSPEDTLKTLEAMFTNADYSDESPDVTNPDYPDINDTLGAPKKKASVSLKQYVEAFSRETLSETARIVSAEGVTLVERHTGALFGSMDGLQAEMQKVLEAKGPAENPKELMERIQTAVMDDEVATLTLTYSTQRRIILEAIAFGSFLRDVETRVDTDYHLLTPAPTQNMPPMLGA